jgi:TolA-binding protein
MPLTPKDDVNGSDGGTANSQAPQELQERVSDVTDLAVAHDQALGELRAEIEERDEKIAELQERVERQEAVLYDLIDVVQALGSGSDWEEFAAGMERVAAVGSDAYPFEWDQETLEFKAERFE